jgi:protein ImuA
MNTFSDERYQDEIMTGPATLDELRNRLARNGEVSGQRARMSSGISALDRLLPDGGWRAGTLIEWLSDPGAGATELAFRSLVVRLRSEQVWCVIDPDGTFSPLPTLADGSAHRCLRVRPRTVSELWWATEQVLRSPGVAVTWCPVDSVPDRVVRRWQLAVEAGVGIGMLFRPMSAARQRSWSDVRLSVAPVACHSRFLRTVRVELMSCRGRLGGQAVMLELHHAPDTLRLVSELDDSTLVAGRTQYALRCAGDVG